MNRLLKTVVTISFTLISNPTFSKSQLINLNLQYKLNNKTVKSELLVPFYQTIELEKEIANDKSLKIEVNPKHGKNLDEVELEMKFFSQNRPRPIYKKEFIAKIGEAKIIKVQGTTFRLTPVL